MTTAFSQRAIAVDSETCRFDRALMAPPVVCVQWGTPDGQHAVVPTAGVRAALARIFDPGNFDQIWLHNASYDIACFLEWYPELGNLIHDALARGAILDTMYLQRMVQIARGDIGGPLGLDAVAPMYGLPAPTKLIEAQVPDWYPGPAAGTVVDVRTSFHLWYGADEIPDPWHNYADYDGVVTIQLAERMVKRHCTPAPGASPYTCAVNLPALAELTRKMVYLNLSRVYGLHINPEAVDALKGAARSALIRLREVALDNGLISPVPATRAQVAAGLRAADRFCPVRYERRPTAPLDPKKLATHDPAKLAAAVRKYERRCARHRDCPGCRWQARDAVNGELVFKKNTAVLKQFVVRAYDGNPPITEPKKDKATGIKKGGGNISTSRDTLQDSENQELQDWAQYNEWNTLMAKDMKIFAHSPVHTNLSVVNTTRQASSNPNILNFRRTSFFVGVCSNEACGFEEALDPRDTKRARAGATYECPMCGPGATAPEVAA